ncbi:MAG: TetR family transcriptional regulator [Azospirillum brasilense]|nr:MAG: TetR family transcriptional regulator [Azospirillum brasilense]
MTSPRAPGSQLRRRKPTVTLVAPGERAPERRRRELLESAIAEFAKHGYGGARIDSIVSRTNSNKAVLYHYFGSKEQLYVAVLEEVYAGIRLSEEAVEFASLSPTKALAKLVQFTFHYYVEHPDFVRILNIENQNDARYLKSSRLVEKLNRPIIDIVENILERGAASGEFRDGIDALDLYISISALGFMYVSNRHTLSAVFGRNLFDPAVLAQRQDAIVDMVLRFVRAP